MEGVALTCTAGRRKWVMATAPIMAIKQVTETTTKTTNMTTTTKQK
jgi:hypothetical protein